MERAPTRKPTDINAIWNQATKVLPLLVIVLVKLGEAELAGDMDLLAAWELELGTAACLDTDLCLLRLGTDGHENLADIATSCSAIALSPSTTHACLETVSTCTRKHLVDAEHLVRVRTHTNVEEVLACISHHVLVSGNACRLKSLTGDLLFLIRDHVDHCWKLITRDAFLATLVDTDLGVWHTTAEPRLGVRLVLTVPVALIRTATHDVKEKEGHLIKERMGLLRIT